MFQRVKNSYQVTAICKNGDKEGTYTFVESYDDDWGDIASSKFYDEFGVQPNEMSLISREQI